MERLNCIVLAFAALALPLAVWLDGLTERGWGTAYAVFMAFCYGSLAWGLFASVIRDRWSRP